MCAAKQDEGYEIDNIPFYAQDLALGDVVAAQSDADGALWYSGMIHPSGHSTLQLWFSKEEEVEPVRRELKKMGCASEVKPTAG